MRKHTWNEGSIEKIFWQSEWQDIKFKSLGIPLYKDRLASSDFYSSFYNKLFSLYRDYTSLPADWLANKTATAKAIGDEIIQNASVLSYGCGLGFIEKELIRYRPDLSVTAFDFADTAGQWIKRDLHGITYTHTVQKDVKYDVIYLSQVLYALSFPDSVDLLKSLSDQLKNNGKIILINTSITNAENESEQTKKTMTSIVKKQIKNFLRPIYHVISHVNGGQFWGWQRNNARYLEMATQAGLKPIKIFPKASQSFIVLSN